MDSRKELEDDIRKWFAEDYYNDYYSEDDMVSLVLGWLDCQAIITEHGIRCEQAIAATLGGVSSQVSSKVSSKVSSQVSSQVNSKVSSKVCGGELTAKQVHDAIFNGSLYASYDGTQYYASGIDMQAIADKLNAMMEKENSDNG